MDPLLLRLVFLAAIVLIALILGPPQEDDDR